MDKLENKKYIIFSDESGVWYNGNYYIRSWIKIDSQNYKSVDKDISYLKRNKNIEELKWGNFKKNYEEAKDIFNSDFDIFISISKPAHFNDIKYSFITKTEKLLENIQYTESSDPKKEKEFLAPKIKERIIHAIRSVLFLNYFEFKHIEASRIALLKNVDSSKYIYIIDKPQFNQNDWKGLAEKLGIKYIKIIKNSSKEAGIELADFVAGCIKSLLDKENQLDKTIYRECIRPKMVNMSSREIPNPNLIFYEGFRKKKQVKEITSKITRPEKK